MVKQVIAFYIVNKYSNIDWLNSERGFVIAANFVTISNQLFSVYSTHNTVGYPIFNTTSFTLLDFRE